MLKTGGYKILIFILVLLCIPGPASAQEAVTQEDDSVRLFCTGEEFYRDLSSALESASGYIFFEYYSVGQDSVSTSILSLLERKIAEGVSVYAIIDDYGSRHRDFPMTDEKLEQYREAGLDIALFNRYDGIAKLPRDHRKLTVIDGVTAFVGGMNINDKYVNHSDDLGSVRDFTARLDGPSVSLLAQEFENVWNEWSGREPISLSDSTFVRGEGSTSVSILPTQGRKRSPTVSESYTGLISSADSTIVMANAYLMPSGRVLRSLKDAARKGVRIDIVTGDRTDLPASLKNRPFRVMKRLSRNGNITIDVLEDTFLHGKVISVDSERVMIGSANLDYLSRAVNLELCIIVNDNDVASQFEDDVIGHK